jgi:hypothetical protein
MTDPVEIAKGLAKHEAEVLRILDGEAVPGWCWGAAMAECLSALKGMKLAEGFYVITPLGREVAEACRSILQETQHDR